MDGYGSTTGRSDGGPVATPHLEVSLPECRQGMPLEIRGTSWQSWPVRLSVDGQAVLPDRVLQGLTVPDPARDKGEAVRPDGTGVFLCRLSTLRMEPGEHHIGATYAETGEGYAQDGYEGSAHTQVVVRAREQARGGEVPPPDLDDGQGTGAGEEPEASDSAFERERFHWERRFGHLGRIPPGARETQISQVRALRERRDRIEAGLLATAGQDPGTFPPPPVTGDTNWTPMGPGPVVSFGTGYSGRALAIAIDPTDPKTVYLGTANGGVWKSTDRGLTWTPKSDFQHSLAIGALAVDPNDHLHIVAGTGEFQSSADTYYGNGLLSSSDGGDTWTKLATARFEQAEITRLVFDPTDSTGKGLLLSSSIGVFESTDGGVDWTLRTGPGLFTDMVVLRVPGPQGTVKVIAAAFGQALWTSTRTNGTWSAWTVINSPELPVAVTFDRVALTQQAENPTVILALFAWYPGFVALARTTDGGATWSAVPMRLGYPAAPTTSVSAGHDHEFTVPASDMTAATAPHTYTSSATGTPAHAHTVSFTAQQFARLAGGGRVTLTTDDVAGHTHTATFGFTNQSWWALNVAVHPTDPNIVFVAERSLWRSSTGGGVFDYVANVHDDHHALVFDPVNPATCWEANDGGIQISTDTGVTWSHRNRDLATLQFESLSLHPEWENVMLGGTQDNGVQRYAGTPAWTLSRGGDGGFTAIDPSKPTRMFMQYTHASILRSDDAGASWNTKNSGIADADVEFYGPFALDPATPTTCYYGGGMLWRSANSGDTWSAVSAAPVKAITAIAVHPTDSTIVYAGTKDGHVYQYRRTGTTWNPADVTRTDLTAAPLPAVWISDIAVDTAGNLWVTIAGLLSSEETGEFINDHVYRWSATDKVWTSRSHGLAQANPINTIVIDPTNSNRLFCGGDLGVFRTEDAGLTWLPWDQGLPNSPVFDLVLHAKSRLLRAATHGRSVWERPVDAAQTKMVDLYVRDTVLDSGRVQPSPSGVADPFDPSATPGVMWWWQSPDIVVDAPEPNYQTATPVGDYVALTTIAHRSARRDRLNRFYVQVHNRGVSAATNVRVRAFLADASAGLPGLPPDFWSGGRPFDADPTATAYTPLGPARTFARLEAAEPGVAEWDFLVPSTAASHSCILAVTTCDEDPLQAAQIFDVGTLVTSRKHATLKNLQVENALPGGVTPSRAFVVMLNNFEQTAQPFTVRFDWANLPAGTRLYITFEKLGNAQGPQPGHGVEQLQNAGQFLPATFTDRSGQVRKFDFARSFVMKPDEHRKNVLKGVHIDPESGSRGLAVNVRLPEAVADRPVEFHVLQEFQDKLLGGSTYVVRPTHPDPANPSGAQTGEAP
ncbi:glycosyl hydrolase [Streptomyces sp. NPDC049602]|uniref:glycosyl hydrolase n=1 Tax=Streptomyces sp. NPDC049602 TaxID=3155504 RepID=UPI00341AF8B6